jgi:type III pantothenate kinase
MVERIKDEIGDATVIATGGLAGLVAPHTKQVEYVEPWLTLHGLRIVHERNHSGALP